MIRTSFSYPLTTTFVVFYLPFTLSSVEISKVLILTMTSRIHNFMDEQDDAKMANIIDNIIDFALLCDKLCSEFVKCNISEYPPRKRHMYNLGEMDHC